MSRRHDRASGSFVTASEAESTAGAPSGGDVLSDVLRAVRLCGALFFRVEISPPWTIALPSSAALAPSILPRAQLVVSYHVVTRGSCFGALDRGGDIVKLRAGDVLVLPHGDAYRMSTTPDMRGAPDPEEVLAFMRQMAAGRQPFTVREGGAGRGRLSLICGFLGCDARPFNPLLTALPRLLVVRQAFRSTNDQLGQLIRFTLAEARERRAGGECIRLHLSELLFVEVVRRCLGTQSAARRGWLAGLRDEMIGRALARLHERPADAWTPEKLAADAGASRSVLAERFTRLVGHPPMRYLMLWRMQVAARLLADGGAKVSAVAAEVGYDSEAAFSRSFKRVAGVPPATWRERHASGIAAEGPRRPLLHGSVTRAYTRRR